MIPSTHLSLINKVKPIGTIMRASKEIIWNVKSVCFIKKTKTKTPSHTNRKIRIEGHKLVYDSLARTTLKSGVFFFPSGHHYVSLVNPPFPGLNSGNYTSQALNKCFNLTEFFLFPPKKRQNSQFPFSWFFQVAQVHLALQTIQKQSAKNEMP